MTHEEARDVLVNDTKLVWNKTKFANDYINQQEKKDELLELYHKALDMMVKTQFQNQPPHYVVRYTDDLIFNNIVDKVKALEKELKEELE